MSVAAQGGGEGGKSWFSPVLSHWHNHSSPGPGGWKPPASYKINAPFFFPFQHLSEVMLGRWDSSSRKEKGGVGD